MNDFTEEYLMGATAFTASNSVHYLDREDTSQRPLTVWPKGDSNIHLALENEVKDRIQENLVFSLVNKNLLL